MRKKIFNKKGFSLIELVVVIAIIAISSAIIVPTFLHMSQESKINQDNIKFDSICIALKSSMSEPEVQKELEEWCDNTPFTVVFVSDPTTGEMNLLNAQVSTLDGATTAQLNEMVLGNHAWQWTDRTYTVAYKESFGYHLTIECTPKTYKTTADAVIVSWAAPVE